MCRPARLVGGDYCDVFEVAPGVVALAVGDVSGKSLGSALVMAHLHALVRSRLSPQPGCPTGFGALLTTEANVTGKRMGTLMESLRSAII